MKVLVLFDPQTQKQEKLLVKHMVTCLIFVELPLEQQGKIQKLVIKWDSFVLLPNKIVY